jgi:hypothetical protein
MIVVCLAAGVGIAAAPYEIQRPALALMAVVATTVGAIQAALQAYTRWRSSRWRAALLAILAIELLLLSLGAWYALLGPG